MDKKIIISQNVTPVLTRLRQKIETKSGQTFLVLWLEDKPEEQYRVLFTGKDEGKFVDLGKPQFKGYQQDEEIDKWLS